MEIGKAIKQKKFESSQQKAMINILYTYNWLLDKTSTLFKDFDITQQQYNVLRILRGKSPQSVCVGEIKEVMLDKNPDLTRLCDRLVLKGFIERELNPDNRRQVLIKITKKGLGLLAAIDPIMRKETKFIFNLNDSESEKLSDLLDKIRG
ncbi:MAG: MarR family transcriptional regulator [Bacteroidetes bacterium]|nr:MarR family transcriptional regulator [Bacteroidota bacterium]